MLNKLQLLKRYDWVFTVSVIFLLAIGISILYSTTLNMAGGSGEALKQLVYASIGLILFFLASKFDYTFLKKFSGIFYVIMVLLLVSLFFYGKTAMGATRWIDLGFFQIQPSEIAKLLMVVVMAKYFSEHHEVMDKPKHVFKSLVFMAIPLGLVALQPDLGTSAVFLIIWLSMVLVSRINKKYLLALGLAGLLLLPVAWSFMADYQKKRVEVFLNPAADPMGAGWNLNQAQIAIGSGGFWGRGLGHGPQSQLNFLPEKHTDFIFAAMAEEMGYLGVTVFLGLFAVVIFRSIKIAQNSKDLFGMYLTTGIAAFLFFHLFVNVGMNTGIMPVTGIPLPLISYGGTAVIIVLTSLGLIQSVARKSRSTNNLIL